MSANVIDFDLADEAETEQDQTPDFDDMTELASYDQTDETEPTDQTDETEPTDQTDETEPTDQTDEPDYQVLFAAALDVVFDNADETTGVPTQRDLVGASVPFSRLDSTRKAGIIANFNEMMRTYLTDPTTFAKARTALEVKVHLERIGNSIVDDPIDQAVRNLAATRLVMSAWRTWDSIAPKSSELQVSVNDVEYSHDQAYEAERERAQVALTDYLLDLASHLESADSENPAPRPDVNRLPASARLAVSALATLDPRLATTQQRQTHKSGGTGSAGKSASPTERAPRAVREPGSRTRDIGAHLTEVFSAIEAGIALTMGEIAKTPTNEYAGTRPSQGAVAAVSDKRLATLGLTRTEKAGRQAYAKLA